jgi:hypothetical protein
MLNVKGVKDVKSITKIAVTNRLGIHYFWFWCNSWIQNHWSIPLAEAAS